MDAAREAYGLSERTACRIVGQPRGTQRYVPTAKPDEDELTRNIVYLASEYGRYGYRRLEVGKDRVQRIWRREGLKVPKKQPKRARLWLNDGSCIRLRPSMTARKAASCQARLPLKGFALRCLGGFLSPIP